MIQRGRLAIDNWSSRLFEAVVSGVSVMLGVQYLFVPAAFETKAFSVLASMGRGAEDAFAWARLTSGAIALVAALVCVAWVRMAASAVQLMVLGFLASMMLAAYMKGISPAPGPALVYWGLSVGVVASMAWLASLMHLYRRADV